MKRFQNLILLALVVILVVLPLLLVRAPKPEPDGKTVEIFTGADGQAEDMIGKIVPDYQPWAEPLLKPPSGEIESLLFVLQAALGAGFIGYWYGSAATRTRLRQEQDKRA
mgnify:FL=1